MAAGYTLGLDKDGRESVVVVVKGTFLTADPSFGAEAGAGAGAARDRRHLYRRARLRLPFESDYAPRKSRCECCSTAAPTPPAADLRARHRDLRVGTLPSHSTRRKARLGRQSPRLEGKPDSALHRRPISYNVAFGGTDPSHPDPASTGHICPILSASGITTPSTPRRSRASPCRTPRNGARQSPAPREVPSPCRLAPSHASSLSGPSGRGHTTRSGSTTFPLPPRRLRREILSGGPAGSADGLPAGRRRSGAVEPDAAGANPDPAPKE